MNIRGSNIKGREWSLELGPSAVLVGDNATGKSAMLAGIRLALTGCLPPPIGKATTSVWAAMAGNPDTDGELWTEVRVGQHAGVYRLVRKKEKVSGDWNADHAITVPEMLADTGAFFRQTANEQLRSILTVTGATTFTVAQLDALIEETTGTPIEVRERWKGEARHALSKCYASPAELAGAFLTQAQTAVKEGKVMLKTRAERVKSLAGAVTNPAPRDVQAELEAMTEKESKLTAEMGEAVKRRELYAALMRNFTEVERLKGRLAEAEKAAARAATLPPAPSHNYERLEELAKVAQRKVTEAEVNNSLVENQMDALKTLRTEADATGLCPMCDCKVANALHFRQKIDTKLNALESNRIDPEEMEELEMALGAATANLQEATEIKAHWEALKAEAEQKVATRAAVVADLKAQIASKSGMAYPEGTEAPPDFDALSGQLVGVRAGLELLKGEARVRLAYTDAIKNRDAAETDLAHLTAAVGFWDSLAKRLAGKMEEASSKAFNALLEKTRLITDDLLASPLCFRAGELGRYVAKADRELGSTAHIGSWISHESFSGTEELIAYAAFAVAVTDGAPYRLVIMDELGRIQGARRRKLVRRMGELVAKGIIHQFIGVDTADVYGIQDDAQVVVVGGRAEEVAP